MAPVPPSQQSPSNPCKQCQIFKETIVRKEKLISLLKEYIDVKNKKPLAKSQLLPHQLNTLRSKSFEESVKCHKELSELVASTKVNLQLHTIDTQKIKELSSLADDRDAKLRLAKFQLTQLNIELKQKSEKIKALEGQAKSCSCGTKSTPKKKRKLKGSDEVPAAVTESGCPASVASSISEFPHAGPSSGPSFVLTPASSTTSSTRVPVNLTSPGITWDSVSSVGSPCDNLDANPQPTALSQSHVGNDSQSKFFGIFESPEKAKEADVRYDVESRNIFEVGSTSKSAVVGKDVETEGHSKCTERDESVTSEQEIAKNSIINVKPGTPADLEESTKSLEMPSIFDIPTAVSDNKTDSQELIKPESMANSPNCDISDMDACRSDEESDDDWIIPGIDNPKSVNPAEHSSISSQCKGIGTPENEILQITDRISPSEIDTLPQKVIPVETFLKSISVSAQPYEHSTPPEKSNLSLSIICAQPERDEVSSPSKSSSSSNEPVNSSPSKDVSEPNQIPALIISPSEVNILPKEEIRLEARLKSMSVPTGSSESRTSHLISDSSFSFISAEIEHGDESSQSKSSASSYVPVNSSPSQDVSKPYQEPTTNSLPSEVDTLPKKVILVEACLKEHRTPMQSNSSSSFNTAQPEHDEENNVPTKSLVSSHEPINCSLSQGLSEPYQRPSTPCEQNLSSESDPNESHVFPSPDLRALLNPGSMEPLMSPIKSTCSSPVKSSVKILSPKSRPKNSKKKRSVSPRTILNLESPKKLRTPKKKPVKMRGTKRNFPVEESPYKALGLELTDDSDTEQEGSQLMKIQTKDSETNTPPKSVIDQHSQAHSLTQSSPFRAKLDAINKERAANFSMSTGARQEPDCTVTGAAALHEGRGGVHNENGRIKRLNVPTFSKPICAESDVPGKEQMSMRLETERPEAVSREMSDTISTSATKDSFNTCFTSVPMSSMSSDRTTLPNVCSNLSSSKDNENPKLDGKEISKRPLVLEICDDEPELSAPLPSPDFLGFGSTDSSLSSDSGKIAQWRKHKKSASTIQRKLETVIPVLNTDVRSEDSPSLDASLSSENGKIAQERKQKKSASRTQCKAETVFPVLNTNVRRGNLTDSASLLPTNSFSSQVAQERKMKKSAAATQHEAETVFPVLSTSIGSGILTFSASRLPGDSFSSQVAPFNSKDYPSFSDLKTTEEQPGWDPIGRLCYSLQLLSMTASSSTDSSGTCRRHDNFSAYRIPGKPSKFENCNATGSNTLEIKQEDPLQTTSTCGLFLRPFDSCPRVPTIANIIDLRCPNDCQDVHCCGRRSSQFYENSYSSASSTMFSWTNHQNSRLFKTENPSPTVCCSRSNHLYKTPSENSFTWRDVQINRALPVPNHFQHFAVSDWNWPSRSNNTCKNSYPHRGASPRLTSPINASLNLDFTTSSNGFRDHRQPSQQSVPNKLKLASPKFKNKTSSRSPKKTVNSGRNVTNLLDRISPKVPNSAAAQPQETLNGIHAKFDSSDGEKKAVKFHHTMESAMTLLKKKYRASLSGRFVSPKKQGACVVRKCGDTVVVEKLISSLPSNEIETLDLESSRLDVDNQVDETSPEKSTPGIVPESKSPKRSSPSQKSGADVSSLVETSPKAMTEQPITNSVQRELKPKHPPNNFQSPLNKAAKPWVDNPSVVETPSRMTCGSGIGTGQPFSTMKDNTGIASKADKQIPNVPDSPKKWDATEVSKHDSTFDPAKPISVQTENLIAKPVSNDSSSLVEAPRYLAEVPNVASKGVCQNSNIKPSNQDKMGDALNAENSRDAHLAAETAASESADIEKLNVTSTATLPAVVLSKKEDSTPQPVSNNHIVHPQSLLQSYEKILGSVDHHAQSNKTLLNPALDNKLKNGVTRGVTPFPLPEEPFNSSPADARIKKSVLSSPPNDDDRTISERPVKKKRIAHTSNVVHSPTKAANGPLEVVESPSEPLVKSMLKEEPLLTSTKKVGLLRKKKMKDRRTSKDTQPSTAPATFKVPAGVGIHPCSSCKFPPVQCSCLVEQMVRELVDVVDPLSPLSQSGELDYLNPENSSPYLLTSPSKNGKNNSTEEIIESKGSNAPEDVSEDEFAKTVGHDNVEAVAPSDTLKDMEPECSMDSTQINEHLSNELPSISAFVSSANGMDASSVVASNRIDDSVPIKKNENLACESNVLRNPKNEDDDGGSEDKVSALAASTNDVIVDSVVNGVVDSVSVLKEENDDTSDTSIEDVEPVPKRTRKYCRNNARNLRSRTVPSISEVTKPKAKRISKKTPEKSGKSFKEKRRGRRVLDPGEKDRNCDVAVSVSNRTPDKSAETFRRKRRGSINLSSEKEKHERDVPVLVSKKTPVKSAENSEAMRRGSDVPDPEENNKECEVPTVCKNTPKISRGKKSQQIKINEDDVPPQENTEKYQKPEVHLLEDIDASKNSTDNSTLEHENTSGCTKQEVGAEAKVSDLEESVPAIEFSSVKRRKCKHIAPHQIKCSISPSKVTVPTEPRRSTRRTAKSGATDSSSWLQSSGSEPEETSSKQPDECANSTWKTSNASTSVALSTNLSDPEIISAKSEPENNLTVNVTEPAKEPFCNLSESIPKAPDENNTELAGKPDLTGWMTLRNSLLEEASPLKKCKRSSPPSKTPTRLNGKKKLLDTINGLTSGAESSLSAGSNARTSSKSPEEDVKVLAREGFASESVFDATSNGLRKDLKFPSSSNGGFSSCSNQLEGHGIAGTITPVGGVYDCNKSNFPVSSETKIECQPLAVTNNYSYSTSSTSKSLGVVQKNSYTNPSSLVLSHVGNFFGKAHSAKLNEHEPMHEDETPKDRSHSADLRNDSEMDSDQEMVIDYNSGSENPRSPAPVASQSRNLAPSGFGFYNRNEKHEDLGIAGQPSMPPTPQSFSFYSGNQSLNATEATAADTAPSCSRSSPTPQSFDSYSADQSLNSSGVPVESLTSPSSSAPQSGSFYLANESLISSPSTSRISPIPQFSGFYTTDSTTAETKAEPAKKLVTFCTDEKALCVPVSEDAMIPCCINIVGFAQHYRLPNEHQIRTIKQFPELARDDKLKLSTALTKYIKHSDGDNSLLYLKSFLSSRKILPTQLAKGLCEILAETKPKPYPTKEEAKGVPSYLSQTQKKALVLLVHMGEGNHSYFDQVLTVMEQFLSTNPTEQNEQLKKGAGAGYGNIASVYALLCRSQGFSLRAQAFIFDLLYGRHISYFQIILKIITFFPAAMPYASPNNGPLTYTIGYLMMMQGIYRQINDTELMIFGVTTLRNKLQHKFGYTFPKDLTRDHVLDELMNNIMTKGCDKAIILICKSQGFRWAHGVALRYIFPFLNKVKSGDVEDDFKTSRYINILGEMSRGFAISICTPFVKKSLELLQDILEKKPSTMVIESVISALVHFQRLDFQLVTQILCKWTPPEGKVSVGCVKAVKRILAVKCLDYWKALARVN